MGQSQSRDSLARWRKASLRLLSLIARPVRRAQGDAGMVVEPYRGYGSREEIFLIGRVFRQSHAQRAVGVEDARAHLRDIGRRIRRHKVAGVSLTARFCGTEERVTTDRDGYFRIHLRPREIPNDDIDWHSVALTLDCTPPVQAKALVFIPPARCRFVVISDIDDTVMHTGVANKLKMLWRLFVADARSRVAFPGVAALYRALHAGVTGNDTNPMLYVSRAPWGIYEMLSEFFRLHAIPVGPVMFLREWGLSLRHPLPRRAEDHKRDLINHMLALYHDRPFVLIGDSGQHDPEVYAQIIEAHPGRIRAVYIRDVSRNAERAVEIERLSQTALALGTSLVLATDSAVMAQHAAEIGLIAEGAVAEVATERMSETRSAQSATTRQVDNGHADWSA